MPVVRYTWIMGSKKRKKPTLKLSDFGSFPNTPEFAKHQKDFLDQLFYQDRIIPTWKNLGSLASRMYEDAQEAFDVLSDNANKSLKATDLKRFYLTKFIEDQRNKKINKGKGLRTIINENLENCCKLINIPFDDVGSSKTQKNENRKLRSESYVYAFDQIVERIDRKYRRVVDDPKVKRKFNTWQRDEFRKKEFSDFLKKPIPRKK